MPLQTMGAKRLRRLLWATRAHTSSVLIGTVAHKGLAETPKALMADGRTRDLTLSHLHSAVRPVPAVGKQSSLGLTTVQAAPAFASAASESAPYRLLALTSVCRRPTASQPGSVGVDVNIGCSQCHTEPRCLILLRPADVLLSDVSAPIASQPERH